VPGHVFGGWRIVAPLGRGGTAEVWRAVAADGREAALKLPIPALERRAGAADLLRREHELLRAVASEHIVASLGLVRHAGGTALALELLPHGDLVPLLGSPAKQWLRPLRAVVAAVAQLHRHGVAHGDLKARNVLFAADGTARLIDLTAARALHSRAVATTAAYSLPRHNETRGGEADCFALAALLYELVTGRSPYGSDGPQELGEAPPAVTASGPRGTRLAAAAVAALRAGGRLSQGVSYFEDVLESVEALPD
jgi:serine/threonine-protein kinase